MSKRKSGQVPLSTFLVFLTKGPWNFTKHSTNLIPSINDGQRDASCIARCKNCFSNQPGHVRVLQSRKLQLPEALSAACSNQAGHQQNQKAGGEQNSFYQGMTFPQLLSLCIFGTRRAEKREVFSNLLLQAVTKSKLSLLHPSKVLALCKEVGILTSPLSLFRTLFPPQPRH